MENTIDNTNLDTVLARGGTLTPTTFNAYLSTTGSDTNDGLSAATPKLTFEAAADLCPLLLRGVFNLNIADGTYQLTDEYQVRQSLASVGLSSWPTVFKVIGNHATPGNVIIKAKDINTTAFSVKGNTSLVYFDGIDIQDCNIGIFTYGARVTLGDIKITNYRTDGVIASYNSQIDIPSGGVGIVLASDGLSASSQGILSTVDSSVLAQSPITVTGFKGSGSRGLTAILNSNINIVTNATLTAEAISGAENGILASQLGQVIISGTLNISNVKDITFAGVSGAVAATNSGRVSIASGSTINFTDCYNDFLIQAGSSIVETTGGSTYNHTGATNKVVVYESGVVDSANYLNGGVIVYRTLQFAGPLLGYDNRYQIKPMVGHSGILPAASSVYMARDQVQSTEFIAYEATGGEQIMGMYIASRVQNGVGITDTYTVRLNGADTTCAIALTNTGGGSVTVATPIALTALDRLSVRVDTGITLAEDVTVTLIINKK